MSRNFNTVIFLVSLFGLACGFAMLAEGTTADEKSSGEVKMFSIYALSRDLEPFKGKSEEEIARWLIEHHVNAIFGGYQDAKLVDTLHKHGIKVYAEVGIFRGEKYWKSHPASHPINSQGKPIEKIEWYAGVCPNQQWLREEKIEQIEKLVRDNGVDGIWLDFIRYPCHWEVLEPVIEQTCFCPVCLKQFSEDEGTTIPAELKTVKEKAAWILGKHRERFIDWKTSRIALFVQRAREAAKGANPEVTVGLFGVPWKEGERDDAIRAIIAQDYRKLARYVDVFSPMVYHKMCGKEVSWITDFTKYLHQITGKQVVPIIQACSLPTKLSNAEFEQAIKAALEMPSSGVIVFAFRHFFKEDRTAAWMRATASQKPTE
jgi:hypothetical protein